MIQALEPAIIILSLGISAALIFGSFALVGGFIKKTFRNRDSNDCGDEALLIKEVYSKLNRLEQRIESLETILTNAETKRHNY